MSPTRIVPVVAAAFALLASVASISVARNVAAPPPLAPKGVERSDMDFTADPCDDFDAFASGAWRAANPIPAGKRRWNRRAAAREANRRQLKDLLEELAATTDRAPRDSAERRLGDYYAACMDETAIERAGVAPLAPLLAEIAAVRDDPGVQRMIRRLHDLAVPVPFSVTGA